MFEFEHLLGETERGIALQTRLGRDIPNSSGVKLTEKSLRDYELLITRHGSNWQRRREPSGLYNCAGHVWAARRTGIFEPSDWSAIFTDDGYRKTGTPAPDDLIVYSDKEQGILHIGRIVELARGVSEESPRIARVVSKWSIGSGEVIHFEADVPFRKFGFDLSWEYWTDRPEAVCEDSGVPPNASRFIRG